MLTTRKPTGLMRRALANLRPEPPIVAAARRARAAKIRLALLSNSFGIEPYNPYGELGMCDGFFDALVVLSELEGVRKPSPLIYQRALKRLDSTGHECVFVDDHADDLPPAAALGVRPVDHQTAFALACGCRHRGRGGWCRCRWPTAQLRR